MTKTEQYIKNLEKMNEINDSIILKQKELISILENRSKRQDRIIDMLKEILSKYEPELIEKLKELAD